MSETGRTVGRISDEDFQFLVDNLEEESTSDSDYYIDQATIELLEDAGAPEALIDMLRAAVGDGDGAEIRWEQS